METTDSLRTETSQLPVKLLTELISPEEIIEADNVRETHQAQYCPVGISLPKESDVALKYHCGSERFSEFRYTPRAYFAVRVWETVRDNLLTRPEFAGALEIEWYPVAATFRSVRFVNGGTERFITAMFEEMRRIADSRTVEIRYGRFDLPALPTLPDYPRRYYIMPQELLTEKRGYGMKDELKPLQNTPAGNFSWNDIKYVFVILKPIQLAYIAGDEMNRHTPLDEEFIDACGEFDLTKVKELVAKGANIHAAGQYGDTAMSNMMFRYASAAVDENGHCRFDNKNRDKFIELAEYLLSLGYNINLAGYADSTCLDAVPHVEDMDIAEFLLAHGANPNLGSFIGDFPSRWHLGRTVLDHIWEDLICGEDPWCEKLSTFLLRHGALPVPEGEPLPEDELEKIKDYWKEQGQWDDSLCSGLSNADAALMIHCAQNFAFSDMALVAQNGGNVNVRDPRGRNLLQIVLEDAGPTESSHKYFQKDLAEMSLMLLCGLKLQLSEAEIERAKETCRAKNYTEALDAISSVVDS